MEKDDLALQRLQLVNQPQHALQGLLTIDNGFAVLGRSSASSSSSRQTRKCSPISTSGELSYGDVMRDAIHPGPQRTASVQGRKTTPQRNVDILQQIAPSIRIDLIRPRQTAIARPKLAAASSYNLS